MQNLNPSKEISSKKWNYIISAVVFVIGILVSLLVDDIGKLAFLSASALPLLFILNTITDVRQPKNRKLSAYIVLVFSVLLLIVFVTTVILIYRLEKNEKTHTNLYSYQESVISSC